MKKLSCDLCAFEAQGETFEEWMNALKPHYAGAHMDFLMTQMATPKEEQQKAMEKWMEVNRERFNQQEAS